MNYGVTTTSIVPIRKEASEQSEMTSQLLFGEIFQIVEKRKKWWGIKCHFDDYEGYIDPKMAQMLNREAFINLESLRPKLTHEIITEVFHLNNTYPIKLFPGSEIRGLVKGGFSYGKKNFQLKNDISLLHKDKRTNLVEIGKKYLNSPYLWGGKSPFGIDCSGLTQTLYKLVGIQLPRDAKDQIARGVTLNFINEAQPGDLAFFDNEEGNIIHVGMIIEPGKILHASGHVRIDAIDHQGIYNHETKQYSHKLRVIHSIIN